MDFSIHIDLTFMKDSYILQDRTKNCCSAKTVNIDSFYTAIRLADAMSQTESLKPQIVKL